MLKTVPTVQLGSPKPESAAEEHFGPGALSQSQKNVHKQPILGQTPQKIAKALFEEVIVTILATRLAHIGHPNVTDQQLILQQHTAFLAPQLTAQPLLEVHA